MIPVAYSLWYADGTVKTQADGPWDALPSTSLVVAVLYYSDTYQQWLQDYDERGERVNPRLVTKRYCRVLTGYDYCWLTADGDCGEGNAPHVPSRLPAGAVKSGVWMEKADYLACYQRATADGHDFA